jgi:membrane-bound serine protease (ClpP class)
MEALISNPFYSFLFIGTGLVFLLLEIFLPSAGVLGLLSLGFSLFGIFGLFYQGNTFLGLLALGGTGTLAFFLIRFGLRRISFTGTLSPEVSSSVDDRIENLLGKEGVTYTPLHPAGVAVIDGKKVDVVTGGEYLEQNVRVRVIDNSGNRVVVRVLSLEAQG